MSITKVVADKIEDMKQDSVIQCFVKGAAEGLIDGVVTVGSVIVVIGVVQSVLPLKKNNKK